MTQNNNTYPELHIRVAWYYYKAEMTQGEIANRLGVPSSEFSPAAGCGGGRFD